MSIKSRLKPNAKNPFLGGSMLASISEFERQLNRGDKVKISKKYNIDYRSVCRFFDSPDYLSNFTLSEIYIAVEGFLGDKENEF